LVKFPYRKLRVSERVCLSQETNKERNKLPRELKTLAPYHTTSRMSRPGERNAQDKRSK
ncbi:hypothetical protein M9458_050762, partial [Cirrhinus mrigala]